MDKRIIRLVSVIIIITGLAFWTCQPAKDHSIYVGISKFKDNDHYNAYKSWLQGVDSNIVLVDLYHLPPDSALIMLEKCSGLLMSGGADVHPAWYGQPEDTVLCEIDYYRDTLEMALLKKAEEMQMPVFGICRGLQMLNVYKGGSLYPDIPERFSRTVSHRSDDGSFDRMHEMTLVEGTRIHLLTGLEKNEVNSSHHQGIDRLAKPFRAAAFSPDTLIEAIELADTAPAPFMMAVQWHPERLGLEHPLSGPFAKAFVEAVKAYREQTAAK